MKKKGPVISGELVSLSFDDEEIVVKHSIKGARITVNGKAGTIRDLQVNDLIKLRGNLVDATRGITQIHS